MYKTSVNKEGEVTPGILDHMMNDFGAGSFDLGNEGICFQTLFNDNNELYNDLRDLFIKIKQEVHIHI